MIGNFILFILLAGMARAVRVNTAQTCDISRICNDVLSINNDIQIPIICDDAAKATYSEFPEVYQNDIDQLHSALLQSTQAPNRLYKIAFIMAQNADFKIKLISDENLQEDIKKSGNTYSQKSVSSAAAYSMLESTLKMPFEDIRILPLPVLKSLLSHELHHAFISVLNRYNGLHRSERYGITYWGASPCEANDPSRLLKIITRIRQQLNDYLSMFERNWLDNLDYPRTDIEKEKYPDDIKILQNLMHLTREYEPAMFKTLVPFDAAIKDDLIDENHQIHQKPHRIMDVKEYGRIWNIHLANARITENGVLYFYHMVYSFGCGTGTFALLVEKPYENGLRQRPIGIYLDENGRLNACTLKNGNLIHYDLQKLDVNTSNEIISEIKRLRNLEVKDKTKQIENGKQANAICDVISMTGLFARFQSSERMKAAILDAHYYIEKAWQIYGGVNNTCDSLLAETDAYLHEIYGGYPELFHYLFPELVAYHKERGEPLDLMLKSSAIKQCLSTAKEKLNLDKDSFFKSLQKELINNLNQLKNSPNSSPLIFFRVIDTYRQISIQQLSKKDTQSALNALSDAFLLLSKYVTDVKGANTCLTAYMQIMDDYLEGLISQDKYTDAQVVLKQTFSSFPANYQFPHQFSWQINYFKGNISSYFGQYNEAETFLKESKRQLFLIFDKEEPQFNVNIIDDMIRHSQQKIKNLYRDLVNVQLRLEKYNSAKQTQTAGREFLKKFNTINPHTFVSENKPFIGVEENERVTLRVQCR